MSDIMDMIALKKAIRKYGRVGGTKHTASVYDSNGVKTPKKVTVEYLGNEDGRNLYRCGAKYYFNRDDSDRIYPYGEGDGFLELDA